jgi:hypothetical protein
MAANRIVWKKGKDLWDRHKIKIAATLFAVFIWFLVVTGDNYEYRTTIPIEITQPNPEYIITSPIPPEAAVQLQGPGKHLFSFLLFREGRLRLNIDKEPGVYVVRPTDSDISLSGSAKRLFSRRLLWPDTIVVKIENLITRKVPVRNNIKLKPQPGYTIVGEVVYEPDSVRVLGPENPVRALDSLYTKSIQLADLKYPFSDRFNIIQPPNEQIQILDPDIAVEADIQKLLEKTISNIPVTVRYLPHQIEAKLIPPQLSLKVQGGVNVVFPLTDKNINAYIEYRQDLESHGKDFPIIIEPIPGVRFRDIKPDRFRVRLSRRQD